MQELTVLIAIIAVCLVFMVSPLHSLVIYIASLAWYPTYLTVPVGTVDFTLRRFIILAIYVKLFLMPYLLGRFKWSRLDQCLIVYFIAQFIAVIFNGSPFLSSITNLSGAVFDKVLPYFAVRIIIQDRQQYVTVLNWILVIVAPLAIVGFYESMTGINLFGSFKHFYAWKTLANTRLEDQIYIRAGFYRASVTFSHPIMFGLYFAMLGPVCAGLWVNAKKNRILIAIGLTLMCLGVFSSMSSGPLLAIVLAALMIIFYHWRIYWKPIVTIIFIMCGLVEVTSNRHFYDVLSGFAFDGSNAWYRSKLIDVALFEGGMNGHWLVGFPLGTDPGWGPKIAGFGYTDIVNQYLLELSSYGLLGLLSFFAMNLMAIMNLIRSFKNSRWRQDKWFIWCLAGSLFGFLIAIVSVSIYGPPLTVYYILLGFTATMLAVTNEKCI